MVVYTCTHTHTQGDGRYAISNSKDQSIKLWDMRRFASQEGVEATLNAVKNQGWDYRFQMVPKSRTSLYKCLKGLKKEVIFISKLFSAKPDFPRRGGIRKNTLPCV